MYTKRLLLGLPFSSFSATSKRIKRRVHRHLKYITWQIGDTTGSSFHCLFVFIILITNPKRGLCSSPGFCYLRGWRCWNECLLEPSFSTLSRAEAAARLCPEDISQLSNNTKLPSTIKTLRFSKVLLYFLARRLPELLLEGFLTACCTPVYQHSAS